MSKLKHNLLMNVKSETLARIKDIDSPEFRDVARKIIHNHEVVYARAQQATKLAKAKSVETLATLTSARAVALGFES